MTLVTTEKSPSIEIEVKENDNNEQFNDLLIQPAVEVNVEQAVKPSSLTIVERFTGIIYTLLAAFIFTVSIFITKQLNVDLVEALIGRFLFQTIIFFIYIKFIKHYPFYKQMTKQGIGVLIVHVIFGTTGFFAFFIAYRYLPLPDITTIRYTQIIWTAIIISILYCERPSIAIVLGIILTIVGVIFVAQPKFLFEKTSSTIKKQSENDYHDHLKGFILAFYSSIGTSIMLITNKYLLTTYKAKHSSLMLHYSFVSLILTMIYLYYKYYFINDRIQSIKNDFLNWRYLCAFSVCSLQILTSIFIQKAIKREHPSIFTIVQASDILFALLLQNIFSSMKSNLLSLFGSILVLCSIIIISGYKFISGRKKTQRT